MSRNGNIFNPLRGTCINPGCNRQQVYYRKDKKGHPTYRSTCSSCHEASIGRSKYKIGVTPMRKGICSNTDGHLGWECNFDPTIYPAGVHPPTQIDHIDGNHQNNDPANHDELCSNCHDVKTVLNGDNKKGRAAKKEIVDAADEKFKNLFD